MLLATNTKALGVNAAFLQEIKDSHPDLTHVVQKIRHVCQAEATASETAKRLIDLLHELRDCLAFQFALEESYGYIENAEAIPTSVAELAERARGEHCGLYLEISSLCEQAEELQYRGYATDFAGELVQATEEFDAKLVRHERLEAELVELAYRALRI